MQARRHFGILAVKRIAQLALEQLAGRQARQFLEATLWPDLLSEGRYVEPALWMKFLFYDSGEARTPERALARLYDFMPGVRRPDFVDW